MVQLTAAQFVTELVARWRAAHPVAPQRAEGLAREVSTGGRSIPTGAIFVSYASEDLEAAARLAEGLRSAGLEVWFDKDALQMGEDWARSIRRGIKGCSLFLPVISRQAIREENRRSYFWREWNDAADYAREMAPDEPFIVPVVVDDTHIDRAPLPDPFKRAQSKSLPNGSVTPNFAELLKELVRDFHRRQRAA